MNLSDIIIALHMELVNLFFPTLTNKHNKYSRVLRFFWGLGGCRHYLFMRNIVVFNYFLRTRSRNVFCIFNQFLILYRPKLQLLQQIRFATGFQFKGYFSWLSSMINPKLEFLTDFYHLFQSFHGCTPVRRCWSISPCLQQSNIFCLLNRLTAMRGCYVQHMLSQNTCHFIAVSYG